MSINLNDAKYLELWYQQKARKNFWAYRRYIRGREFLYNWFIVDMTRNLQQFYIDYKRGLKPIYIFNTPPQHGKSWALSDLISFICADDPGLRVIFGSFSDALGIRTNNYCQRTWSSSRSKAIFPDFNIPLSNVVTQANQFKRNKSLIEYYSVKNQKVGYFRNTTVNGAVTGESLDIGIIDDPLKGRKEANSKLILDSIWDWFTDDYYTRASKNAGFLIVMTRWGVSDLVGRILARMSESDNYIKLIKYKAIAEEDEQYRKKGEALFPELKDINFLLKRKSLMTDIGWQSTYQQEPILTGGNIFKESYWRYWTELPKLKLKFITVDTAQKTKTINDYTVFQCWGLGVDGKIYLLDKLRDKLESPDLRKYAYKFYQSHNTPVRKPGDIHLQGMYIEDKSSGTGLIQELKRLSCKIYNVQRSTDKVFRAEDDAPYVASGHVLLNKNVPGVENIVSEGKNFPNDVYDDDIDCTMTAIEVVFIEKLLGGSLMSAMGG
ncbi:MAG: chaperone and heat shock protein 70 [Candidatus Magnetoglobus multicellularis str. Araruama]|uniref:Chaperone and heat shock protein 70 n=1 Tax=Candidatus Magnetoglobus multicellularis str. Araruama TaxID=890399 RepID=A0A1V1PDU9_9BACT|nr:MAG: chaperone and heat shock protein 70 [Candidatus Magnetoglobus multicellularis str. Araruama]